MNTEEGIEEEHSGIPSLFNGTMAKVLDFLLRKGLCWEGRCSKSKAKTKNIIY